MQSTDPHHDHINLAADKAADPAVNNADDQIQKRGDKPDRQGNPRAVHNAHHDIAAQLVRAHQMHHIRQSIAVGQILTVIGKRRNHRNDDRRQSD